MSGLTPSQTVGPVPVDRAALAGRPVRRAGGHARALLAARAACSTATGEPVTDALVETWQADPDGRFDHPDDPRGAAPPAVPGFRGFGRSETLDGRVRRPHASSRAGCRTASGGLQAPHVDVSVFARGLLDRVVTRLYFADEAEANAEDPVLRALPADAARRRCSPSRRRGRLPPRRRAAGRRRDGLLPCLTPGGLFDGVLARGPVAGDGRTTGLAARAARGRGGARARRRRRSGLVPPGGRAADRRGLRATARASTSRRSGATRPPAGNPVVPLVRALERGRRPRGRAARAPGRDQPGRHGHRDGARRAARARRCSPPTCAPPRDAAAGARRGAPRHASSPGARCCSRRCRRRSGSRPPAGSSRSTRRARTGWPRCAARLPAQLGGAVGTLSAAGPGRLALVEAYARRARPGRAGAAPGTPCGCRSPTWPARSAPPPACVGKVGARRRPARPERGRRRCAEGDAGRAAAPRPCRTSATPSRPCRARAAAPRRPPASSRPCSPRMEQEHERAAGRLARRVASRCRTCCAPSAAPPPGCADCLGHLEVDAARMRANLDAAGRGAGCRGRRRRAHRAARPRAAARRARGDRGGRRAGPRAARRPASRSRQVAAVLDADALDALLDPARTSAPRGRSLAPPWRARPDRGARRPRRRPAMTAVRGARRRRRAAGRAGRR